MKRVLFSACIGILICAGETPAVETAVDAMTVFRIEQRDIPGFSKENLAPATQFLTVDFRGLGDGNLSLHLSGWGRADLADKSYNDRKTDGNLAYGYLQYRLGKGNAVAKAGRFFVFEGVANEQLDGAYLRGEFARGAGAAVFGGVPVSAGSARDNFGSYVVGGRGYYRHRGIFEIGASALREANVTTVVSAADAKDYRQLVGGDLWASPLRGFEVSGHTYYNTATGGVAENSWLGSYRANRDFTIFADFNENRLRDLTATSSIRSVFSGNTLGDKFRGFGGGVTYRLAKPVEATADFRHYTRDQGNSNRFGGELRVTLLENAFRSGVAYHRLSGGSGVSSYHEARAFALHDAKSYFSSVDVIGHYYGDSVYGKKQAYFILGSLGYKILPGLSLSGDVSYGSNPQFSDEVRGLLRLTYAAEYPGKGVKK